MPAPPPESEPGDGDRDRRHGRPRFAERRIDDGAQLARRRLRIARAARAPRSPRRRRPRPRWPRRHCSRRCRQWRRPASAGCSREWQHASIVSPPRSRSADRDCPWTRSRTHRRCRHSREERSAPLRRLRDGLDRQPDDRARPKKPPRILDRHILLPDMHAIGPGRERDVDAVVDEERHPKGASAALIARAVSTMCASRRACREAAPGWRRPRRPAVRARASSRPPACSGSTRA